MPTIADYIGLLTQANPPGLDTYEHYLSQISARWGARLLDEPTALEIEQFVAEIQGR